MQNLFQHFVLFLFPKECNGVDSPLANQLIYSQLKNRLIMMTQKPSTALAKLKFSGVVPLLLISMLIFSFREREQSPETQSSKIYNIYDDGLEVYGFEITEQPLFPGCEKVNVTEKADCSQKKMFEYVAQQLKYPEDMKASKIEGKVYVKFVITEKGDVADVQVQKSLTPSADKAALDIVNGMNKNVGKWTPGTKNGKPVTMDMVLPISFVLGTQPDQSSKPNIKQEEKLIEMPSQTDEPFTYVEHMPTFPEGQQAMYKFIYERIKYPATARENGISGVVVIQFVVSKEGDIQNAKVLRGIGGGCNEEALRVINEMPRWNPGQHDGRNVSVTFTLPIKFVLQDPKPNTANSIAPAENSEELASPNTLEETKVIALKEATKHEVRNENIALKISPNPASDHITIELFEGAQTILLFTADGIQIAKTAVSKSAQTHYRIDTTKYPVGQYSVQVVSPTETRSALFTVIK